MSRPARRTAPRLLLALSLLAVVAAPTGVAAAATDTPVGTVVVTTDATADALERLPGVDVEPQGPGPSRGALRAEVTATGARALAARSDVVSVEPDVPVAIDAGDPEHASNWAADVLDLGSAWQRSEGAGIVVAVLDTGVARHPELTGRLLAGADVIGGTGDGRDDPHGHGTMSALTIAAGRDDGIGAIGVCPSCSIMPIRVLAADGGGSLKTITDGIHAALDRDADVISISASGTTSSTPRYLAEAIQRATAAGVPIVASAGNDGTDVPAYPAADAGVIGVAGSNAEDDRYGWSNHGSWVDVAAPGCYRISSPTTPTVGRWYCGTSAAAPVVSGALALARAAGRPADVPALRGGLTATSRPLDYVASGRVDVCPLMTGTLQPPTVSLLAPTGGATVEDGDTVTVSTRDDCGLAHITVRLGSTEVAAGSITGTSVPRAELVLDLAAVPAGDHTLRVTVTDEHGRDGLVEIPVTRAGAPSSTPPTSDDPDATRPTGDDPDPAPEPSASDDPEPPTDGTTPRFTDVSGIHAGAIAELAARGVTTGCARHHYCPTAQVTRAQMATFLVRAVDPAPRTTAARFRDVAGGTHADAIARLAAAGITTGCTPDRYCPDQAVTRAQMATFLVRALDLAPVASTSSARFGDVSGTHADAIARLAAAGVTTGCSPDRYCPDELVTRAQMATFLVRALES